MSIDRTFDTAEPRGWGLAQRPNRLGVRPEHSRLKVGGKTLG
jgi:hypothetical protein